MSRSRVFGFGLVTVLSVLAGCAERPRFVIDEAGLFSDAERARLAMFHELLLTDHAIDYRVLTVPSAPDINQLSVRRFAELGAGEASPAGHGLLLVVDTGGEKVRMEVGYDLEGYFPDAFVAFIENRQMLPFFAADRPADGILATTELIVDRAQRYRLGETEFEASGPAGSGGAGATARMDDLEHHRVEPAGQALTAGRSPEETLARYLDAMGRRDSGPDLPIYTPETRAMLRGWVMTPAQMDNLVATYRNCDPQSALLDPTGTLAVIRYDVEDRRCAPWFFQRAGDIWLLDLTMMSRAIRFGRDNSWHFDLTVEHPYTFAFEDWQFDPNGFPR